MRYHLKTYSILLKTSVKILETVPRKDKARVLSNCKTSRKRNMRMGVSVSKKVIFYTAVIFHKN